MAYFTRSDLKYSNYVWNSSANHDDPTKTHFPDNTLLATREGYEMVTFINAVARHNKWPADKAPGHKLERMLKEYLPTHLRGRIDVINWVSQNWNNYQQIG